jgi:hypothetical protein
MRKRWLWSLAASAIFNAVAWTWSGHLALLRYAEPQTPERVAVSVSPVRFERPPAHQAAPKRKPKPKPAPTLAPVIALRTPTPIRKPIALPHRQQHEQPQQQRSTPMLAPPPPATLALPKGWSRQDFGFLGTTKAAEWIDWKNQSAKWVPRVFVWRIDADPAYMSRPSLRDAIAQVLSTLHDERAKMYASRAQAVCNGQRPGWFLSYVKTEDDPPLHMEETIFMDGSTIYRATYVREAGQQEDAKTRAALNTLCV